MRGSERQAAQSDWFEYVLTGRRISGSKAEVLEQLDDLIQALVGVRQLLELPGEHLVATPTRRLRLLRSLLALTFVVGLTTLAGAQTLSESGAAAATAAQPPANPDVTYGGFLDVAYPRAFNDPPNKLFRSRGTAWHLNDPYMNMAGGYSKKKATEHSRWGTELLVQTGKDDEVFGFSATAPNMEGSDFLRHLGLANASYLAPVAKGLTVQGGIFASLIGYDSLYAKDNLNYTRPWGADFTPYLMLGANASYPFSDKLTGTFYVVNGYWHLANANSVPSSGVQLAYKVNPEITVKETVLAGPHQSNTSFEFWRFLADTIVERRTDRFIFAVNGHLSTEKVDESDPFRAWWVAVQAPMRWNVQGPWSVAVRPEFAWDSTGRWTLAEQTVTALTTTLEYRAPYGASNTLLRLEYRVDNSSGAQGGFYDDHEISPGVVALTPTQHLLIFAAIFTFDASFQP
jgi:Putative beta-barrel porin-2, OmpL-like. bbp2